MSVDCGESIERAAGVGIEGRPAGDVDAPLRVAVVANELPYPPNTGGRIRTWNLLRRLAGRHRITILAHRTSEWDVAAAAIEAAGVECVEVRRRPISRAGWKFHAALLANLVSRRPFSSVLQCGEEMREKVRELASQGRVDLWQLESLYLSEGVQDRDGGALILMTHNVEATIWRRLVEVEAHPLKRLYMELQRRKVRRLEASVCAAVDGVVAVTEEEARTIREDYGGRRVVLVDNGVDRDYFGSVEPAPEPARILFLGSLDWRPNLDAVGLLLDRIIPLVRAEIPGATFDLVGRRPSAALADRVARLDGVELHGDVADVRPHLARSRAMVVPLRIGGGSRLKILEAMTCGLPVVSTRVGAEGLNLIPGRHYVEADSPEAMARALVAVIRDPAPARAAAEEARRFVLHHHDWDVLALRLEKMWRACACSGAATDPAASAHARGGLASS